MIDFLVIGGGIAGVSAAARLSELGMVVLLERETALAYHASGRSAAMFEESYGAPSTRALNTASKDWHLHMGAADTPRGLLLLGRDGCEEAFARDMTDMKLERLSIRQAQQMVPVLDAAYVTQAGYHAEAWDIDTDRVVQHFAATLRRNGGAHHTNAEVTQITRTRQGWRVTAGQDHEARIVVNAAGAWADLIAVLAGIAPVGLTPLRRSMARVAAPDGQNIRRWPLLFGPGESWYAKPDAGALLISPADEVPVPPHDAYADDMALAEGIARYQPHVTTQVTRMLANWAGLRTFAPDRNLVIGRDRSEPAFYWCAGQGGYGFQTAPAASQYLADIIAQRPPEIDVSATKALDPARF